MAAWIKAKLAEAVDSKSTVLEGAIPFAATNLQIHTATKSLLEKETNVSCLIMGMWTKAKLEEAIDLRSVVLGGASPFVPTNF